MTALPPYARDDELPHLGALLKRIRQVRGLSQTDIALALGVTASTISKFESTGRSRRNQIVERYIRLLQEPSIHGSRVPYPLGRMDAALLLQLGAHARGGQTRDGNAHRVEDRDGDRAMQLAAYDFALLDSANCPAALKELLQRLRRATRPAFIMDGLWFIHAVNGALLNLFGIHAETAFLRRWESWHMLAAELVAQSPVRQAHVQPDNAAPHTIWAFFQTTAPYLFTPQMRALQRHLHHLSAHNLSAHNLSAHNRMSFSEWWYSATAFALHFDPSCYARLLRGSGREVRAAQVGLEAYSVPVAADLHAPYFLGIWQPVGAATQRAFESLEGPARPGEVLLAADYDAGRTFHVNCWPEVAAAVSLG